MTIDIVSDRWKKMRSVGYAELEKEKQTDRHTNRVKESRLTKTESDYNKGAQRYEIEKYRLKGTQGEKRKDKE